MVSMRTICIVWMLITVLISACTKEDYRRTYNTEPVPTSPVVPPPPTAPLDTTLVKTYLALGDSYTIGQSVSIEERFPNQVVSLLKQDSVIVDTPEIIARTGWTTFDLFTRLTTNAPLKPTYDVVTLLIGVNNQFQRLPQSKYHDEFGLLLDKAIVYAGKVRKNVIVLSIPDYGVTPFGMSLNAALISRQVDSFNIINKQITLTEGCTYLDITPASREALTNPTLVATDGLHPSGSAYRQWATLLAPIFKAVLKK